MVSVLYGYSFTLFTALIVIAGDTLIKLAVDGGHTITHRLVLAGVVLYGLSALAWFFAMRHVSLAQAGVAYSMLTLLALCFIGAAWFDEPIRLREALGVGCALAAMVLMIRIA